MIAYPVPNPSQLREIAREMAQGIGLSTCSMGIYACANPLQCWEPCGRLGKNEHYACSASTIS